MVYSCIIELGLLVWAAYKYDIGRKGFEYRGSTRDTDRQTQTQTHTDTHRHTHTHTHTPSHTDTHMHWPCANH